LKKRLRKKALRKISHPLIKSLTQARRLGITDGEVRISKQKTLVGKRGVRAIRRHIDNIIRDAGILERQGKYPLLSANVKVTLPNGETGEVSGIVIPLPSDFKEKNREDRIAHAKAVAKNQIQSQLFREYGALTGKENYKEFPQWHEVKFQVEYRLDVDVPEKKPKRKGGTRRGHKIRTTKRRK